MFEAIQHFLAIVGGAEKQFAPGDVIDAATAKELNLASKPDLAKPKGK